MAIILSVRARVSDLDSQSGSGSKRAKLAHKIGIRFVNFVFRNAGCSLLRAEGFSCFYLDGLFLAVNFFQFWSSKPWIRVGIQLKMLDPDLD